MSRQTPHRRRKPDTVALWSDRLLPRLIDVVLDASYVHRLRARALSGLSGDVVEIGFGSGTNVPLYPSAVTSVAAVEPSRGARRLAADRIAASSIPVHFVGLDGQSLPLPDNSCDAAVSTFTLCTVPDPARALREIGRVLRPGGKLFFLEHGLSPDPRVAAWQRRLDGIEQRVAGGCHLVRNVPELVTDAGFTMEKLDTDRLPGPRLLRPWGHLSLGVAALPVRCRGR